MFRRRSHIKLVQTICIMLEVDDVRGREREERERVEEGRGRRERVGLLK